jgi:hypothetical protein
MTAAHKVIAGSPVADCWACNSSFSSGVFAGSGGVCSKCLARSDLTNEQAVAVLPYVWGERASRLQRAVLIVRALNLHR